MGSVFHARDHTLNTDVAVKTIRKPDVKAIERLKREASLGRKVNHRSVCKIFDFHEHRDFYDTNEPLYFITMEYVSGKPLSVEPGSPMSQLDVCDVGMAILDGLMACHEVGVVHRDIKPPNLLRLSDGSIKIVDFGVARSSDAIGSLTSTGGLVGTLPYMSPEQCRGDDDVGPRSDLYSLGIVLFELLTSILPFRGGQFALIHKHQNEAPPLDNFPGGFKLVLQRALAKDARDRYTTAVEMALALRGVAFGFEHERRIQAETQQSAMSARHDATSETLRTLREDALQTEASWSEARLEAEASKGKLAETHSSLKKAEDRVTDLEAQLKETAQRLSESKEAAAEAETIKEALAKTQSALAASRLEADESKQRVSETIRNLREDVLTIEASWKDARQEAEASKGSLAATQASLRTANTRITDLEGQLIDATQQLTESQEAARTAETIKETLARAEGALSASQLEARESKLRLLVVESERTASEAKRTETIALAEQARLHIQKVVELNRSLAHNTWGTLGRAPRNYRRLRLEGLRGALHRRRWLLLLLAIVGATAGATALLLRPQFVVVPSALMLPLGAMAGLALGLTLALRFELIDDTVRTPHDVKTDLGLPFLGMIPQIEIRASAGSLQKLVSDNPQSTVAEAYRLLRTNLLFCSPDAAGMAVIVSSANPTEGKTTIVANLAASLALNGAKVLAIDADLRRPTLHQYFAVHKTPGLSDLIVGKCQASEGVQVTRFKGLHILPCGYLPPNPAELLGSQNMKNALVAFRKLYDWVIIDTAPIFVAADTPVICPTTDGLVLVVAAEATSFPQAQRSIDKVQAVGGKLLGVVLNKVNMERNWHYYSMYYGDYYRRFYAEREEPRERPKAIKRA